ncbi:MAG: hypothetical protein ACFFHD_05630 [Promethearchaeota archaeon]
MKINKLIYLFLFIFISVNFVSAWSNTTFNNSLGTEMLNFTERQNITRYLAIPQNTFIISGRLNLTGIRSPYPFEDPITMDGTIYTSYDYTDYENQMAYGQTFEVAENLTLESISIYLNREDGSPSTTELHVTQGDYNDSSWNLTAYDILASGVIDGNVTEYGWYEVNLSIPVELTLGETYIFFFSNNTGDGSNLFVINYSSSDTYELGSAITKISGTDYWNPTDEDLVFRLNTFPKNVSIAIDNELIWNSTGIFNYTINISGIENIINKYLNSTYLFGTNYLIPFNFYSPTTANINYNGLYFTNIGWVENRISYNENVTEGTNQLFSLNISYDYNKYTSYNISLVYNGTDYPAFTNDTSYERIFNKELVMPNVVNQTNYSFYWKITLKEGNSSVAGYTSVYNQSVNPLEIDNCSTYTNHILNLTLIDEENQTIITDSPEIQAFVSIYDSLLTNLIANLSISTNNSNLAICFNSNFTSQENLSLNAQVRYSGNGYEPEYYNIINLILNENTYTRNISLYDLLTGDSTQFKLTLTDSGVQTVSNALIYVNRFYVGEGDYKTVEIPLTDSKGAAVLHLVNNDFPYQLIAIKDGEVLSTIELTPTCQVTPCVISMAALGESDGIIDQIYDYYAQNIVSTLTYNKTTNNLTYIFVDTTATANYFRLKVSKIMYNQTQDIICDEYAYAIAGTLICDLSDYTGEFRAETFVSRSPELTDKVINIIVDESIIEDLGIDMVFLNLCLLIIIIFGGAIVTRGSPSGVIMATGIGILILKIAQIFPFNWITVVSLEALFIWAWRKVRG